MLVSCLRTDKNSRNADHYLVSPSRNTIQPEKFSTDVDNASNLSDLKTVSLVGLDQFSVPPPVIEESVYLVAQQIVQKS